MPVKIEDVVKELDLSSLTEEQLRRLALLKQEELRLRRDGLLWYYEPMAYQVPFHKSMAKIRFVFGGNRSGKTVSTHVDAINMALGRHEFRKVAVPNNGWIVSIDFPTSRDVSEKMIFDYIPKSELKVWNKVDRVLVLRNGSTIGFKSCDSGRLKFQGTSRHWILFDEEPPYDIFQECLLRTADTRGCIMCAMTPTNGISWVYDEIYERAGVDKNIETFIYKTYDNSYIDHDELDRIADMINPEEKEMRLEGKFIQLSGVIFREYDRNIHVIKGFDIPNDRFKWSKFRGIDHGTNNPTACIWVAVNRENEWYIYDEYYEDRKTIKDNCEAIKTISGGDKYEWSAIDGSTQSVNSVDKSSYYNEYKKNGIYAKPIYLNDVNKRLAIDGVRNLLRVDDRSQKPKFFVFDHCQAFLREFSRYRWKTHRTKDDKNPPDTPQGYLDHAITALMFIVLSKASYQGASMDREPETVKWY